MKTSTNAPIFTQANIVHRSGVRIGYLTECDNRMFLWTLDRGDSCGNAKGRNAAALACAEAYEAKQTNILFGEMKQ